MASWQAHVKKAEHNTRFIQSFDLANTPFLDWVVTGVFYAALHYIRALAAHHGGFTNISRYGEMDRLFNRLALLKRQTGLYFAYRKLKDDSRDARYEMRRYRTAEVQALIANELHTIQTFALANLPNL